MNERFPAKLYSDAGAYGIDYFRHMAAVAANVDAAAMARAGAMLADCARAGRTILSCGNGGSAAIANHLVCDCLKGASISSSLRPRVVSLSANIELFSALANDIGVEDVFAFPLRSLGRPGDVLVTISSSGNSPNIVRAVETAREMGLRTIAMTGFTGGRSAPLAEVNLQVAADNYGIVEDLHQAMMHILAQYLRQAHLEAGESVERLVF